MDQFLSMIAFTMMAKFMLNDIPHMFAEQYESKGYRVVKFRSASEEPPTIPQLRYIALLCQQLGVRRPLEEEVKTQGEAGRLIRELEAERESRKQRGSGNPHGFRLERTTTDKILDDLERTWHRIEYDTSVEIQSALGILKEVMGYYYEEPCVAAWDNTDLVGVAVYESVDDKDRGIKVTHVKELASFTHEPGVGRAIIKEVIKIGREDDSDVVSASYAPGARGFYERLGFVESVYYPEEPTLVEYRLKSRNPAGFSKVNDVVILKASISPEEKLLRSIYGIKPTDEPELTEEPMCECGKYQSVRYVGTTCDRCRSLIKERKVLKLPEGWTVDQGREWYKKHANEYEYRPGYGYIRRVVD